MYARMSAPVSWPWRPWSSACGVSVTFLSRARPRAVIVVRRVRRGLRVLVEAIRGLSAGDMASRLDEEEVGVGAAAAYNQAARDLDERIEVSRARQFLAWTPMSEQE